MGSPLGSYFCPVNLPRPIKWTSPILTMSCPHWGSGKIRSKKSICTKAFCPKIPYLKVPLASNGTFFGGDRRFSRKDSPAPTSNPWKWKKTERMGNKLLLVALLLLSGCKGNSQESGKSAKDGAPTAYNVVKTDAQWR